MAVDWFGKILEPKINSVVLWLRDETRRLVISLTLFAILVLVIYPKTTQFILGFSFTAAFENIWHPLYSAVGTRGYIIILSGLFLLLLISLLSTRSRLFRRTILIGPEKEPTLWSFYRGSEWSIVEDKDSWNKVLKITNCHYPAILKFGDGWIDYTFSFQTKVPSDVPKQFQNFSFVVRAKDKTNNIFFQCKPNGIIRPHLVATGVFLIDENNIIDFPAEYPLDKWIDVCTKVYGDTVSISMMGSTAIYRVPSTRYVIARSMIKPVMSLEEANKLNLEKEQAKDAEKQATLQAPSYLLDLDYEKGTIGFREHGLETALFRKIRVTLRNPLSTLV